MARGVSEKNDLVIADVAGIVDLVDLQDITFIELRAAHKVGLLVPASAEEIPAQNQILHRIDADSIDLRLVTTVENDDVRITIDVLVRYLKKHPFDASDEAVSEFVHRVGLMAGYPYVREAVASLSTKLGVEPITLGLLRAD